ncbi:ERF superfamily protein [Corynebacterium ciconiae DSM 44920]|uniref:ERF family protein n=1 Tax=Corynebacterium ciconiae TaxID=227319 RepID=UPI002647B1B3|nr:ERF family protein [Corynebacterium ciconiae]WKD60893.1 ERF superfamily protein [Corynebacterium ciconiae DSM 44920]
MSEKPTIVEALSAVMKDVSHVAKNDENTHQRFKFRGIDAVMNACGPALRKHGVIAVPSVLDAQYSSMPTRNGGQATVCRLQMKVDWYGPAGDSLSTVVWGEAFDNGDKATAKAHSVAFRTAFLQTLCLPTDEPDPDHDTYEAIDPSQVRAEELARFKDQCEQFVAKGDVTPLKTAVDYWSRKADSEKQQIALAALNRVGDNDGSA